MTRHAVSKGPPQVPAQQGLRIGDDASDANDATFRSPACWPCDGTAEANAVGSALPDQVVRGGVGETASLASSSSQTSLAGIPEGLSGDGRLSVAASYCGPGASPKSDQDGDTCVASASLITELHFHAGGWRDLAAGLIGYLRFRVAGVLLVDGVTVRSTVDGRLTLCWPERRDGSGRRHAIVRPADLSARRAIEAEVMELLADDSPRGGA